MPATRVLVVFARVALGAVLRRQSLRDREALVFDALLPFHRVMTVETVDAFDRVPAPFELVDDGGSLVPVALGALPRCLDQGRRRLADLGPRPPGVHEKRSDDQSRRDDDGGENGLEGHRGAPESLRHAFRAMISHVLDGK
jgi:hypothetical protein